MLRRLVIVLCVTAAGCVNTSAPPTAPPPPPVETKLPPDLAAALPLNDAGLPVLIASQGIELSFDETLDDPVARWGQCVSRVTGCYRVNPRRPKSGCIDKIDRCADDTGGTGCCPSACITAFHDSLRQGLTEDDAVTDSFLKGDCVSGLALELGRVQP